MPLTTISSYIDEFYCRICRPSIQLLYQLFTNSEVAKELPMLLDYLCWLTGMGSQKLFSQLKLGVSFQRIEGHKPSITIFFHVSQFCPNNIEARSRLLKLAGQMGHMMSFYARVSSRLVSEKANFPIHGTISLKPMPNGKMIFSTGLKKRQQMRSPAAFFIY